jgi:hypothetical protein
MLAGVYLLCWLSIAKAQTSLTLPATLNFEALNREAVVMPFVRLTFNDHCVSSVPELRTPEVRQYCQLNQLILDRHEIEQKLSDKKTFDLPPHWSILDLKAGQWNLSSIFENPQDAAELILQYFEKTAVLYHNADTYIDLVKKLEPSRAQALDEAVLPLLIADLKSKAQPLATFEFMNHVRCRTQACEAIRENVLNGFSDKLRQYLPRFRAIDREIARAKRYLVTDSRAMLSNAKAIFAKLDAFLTVAGSQKFTSQKYRSKQKDTKDLIVSLLSRKTNVSEESSVRIIRDFALYSELKKLFAEPLPFFEGVSLVNEQRASARQLILNNGDQINGILSELEQSLTKDNI